MNFQHPIQTLAALGAFFKQQASLKPEIFHRAYLHNNWFTEEYVVKAVSAWGDELTKHKLEHWLGAYQGNKQPSEKKIALIMAGNIPLVGLHDLLCVVLCGHKAIVKLSDDDKVLMTWVIDELKRIDPKLEDRIAVSNERLPKDFDAVIATGSNNTNRYFQYYFKGKPSLLRKSRTSVAVLTGNETSEDIEKLGADIFTYFGLGCRNVSKLYVPAGYDVSPFYEGIEKYYYHIDHHKYANNYTYHKAILLMNLSEHLDNNFLLLKKDERIASPLGVMYYEEYAGTDALKQMLDSHRDEIQCVVSKQPLGDSVPFGKAQEPGLSDYADGVDTMKFLLDIDKLQ